MVRAQCVDYIDVRLLEISLSTGPSLPGNFVLENLYTF